MKCEDTHRKHSLIDEWRMQNQDGIEHDFELLVCDGDNFVKMCTHCSAKKYPDNF